MVLHTSTDSQHFFEYFIIASPSTTTAEMLLIMQTAMSVIATKGDFMLLVG